MGRFRIEEIKHRLSQREVKELHNSRFRESAVLIPILKINNASEEEEYAFILTVRSKKLKKHSGEISFPGGKLEPNESPIDAALRETQEEIGIERAHIQVIGRVEPIITMTGFIINPVVAIVDTIDFILNPEEVEKVLVIPFTFFTTTKTMKEHPYILGDQYIPFLSFDYLERTEVNGFEKKEKFHIWGATAHIITMFFYEFFDIRLFSQEYNRPSEEKMFELFDEFSERAQKELKKRHSE
jgi:8-oxo-dGTP pyrophosphatase MutT (NUDIX family)